MKKSSHCFSIIISLQHGIKSLIFLGVFSSFFFLLLNGFRCIILFHQQSYHHPKLPRSSTSLPYNQSLSNITKLSSTNYLTWSLQIQSLLEGYDLHHFIDDTHTPPPPTITIIGVVSPNPTYTT